VLGTGRQQGLPTRANSDRVAHRNPLRHPDDNSNRDADDHAKRIPYTHAIRDAERNPYAHANPRTKRTDGAGIGNRDARASVPAASVFCIAATATPA